VDHAVGDADRVRQRERGLGRDEMLGQRPGDGHDLEDGAGLVDVGHRVVVLESLRRGGGERVRVIARLHRHREHAAGMRVEDDRRRGLRVPLRNRRAEHLFRVRLDRVVEREEHVAAFTRGPLVLDRDHVTERIADDGLLAGLAGQLRVQL
jgi:hypothetical protein